jgi:nitrogen fixation protein NifU and related proteins
MDLNGLYQEIILDHYKHPRGKTPLEAPLASAYHVNPTCGDEVTVEVAADENGHLLIGYEGQGCSISQASASVMSELLAGSSIENSVEVREAFVAMMHSQGNGEPDEDVIGDGVAFVGVAKYPARVKCALLPWMALQDAEIKAGLMTPKEETR